ncbi:MAG TPA: DNA helicase RecQ [Chitinophagales bacterium]|nr:DNA helicase RecQ [Chitinophagales bacterium]
MKRADDMPVAEPKKKPAAKKAKVSVKAVTEKLSGTTFTKASTNPVDPALVAALKKHFGFDGFKGEQAHIIQSVLDGKDTFVIMPTGGGKSLCYQLPALIKEGTAIIISPLIALMKNQVDALRSYSDKDNVAHFLNSSLTKVQAKTVRQDIRGGKTKMLYIAPETLTKQDTIEFLSEINVSFVAVDEAHCISEWGHDFRPEYRKIRQMVEGIGKDIPIIALTATATPKVQSDILKTLSLKDPCVYISSFNRPNLNYEVRPKTGKDSTLKAIIKFIKQNENKSGIIYSLSRKSTEEIAETLRVNGIKAESYHAGLDASTRSARQDQFLKQDIDVICATIAFGMGIDKPDVRFVMHYNVPKSLENYYQETGRAGRDGLEGRCILFYNPADITKMEKFMKDKSSSEREMGGHLLMETQAFVESAVCRRKFVLHYFGEEYPKDNCGACDNCLNPKETIEGKDYFKLLFETVKQLKESFTIPYIVDIVLGTKNQQISLYGHDKLNVFGEGSERTTHFWNSVVRQALLMNYITKDIENYGVICLSDAGKAFLKKPQSVQITLNHDYVASADDDDDNAAGGSATLDPVLMKILQTLVKEEAKKVNLPPYIVFQESSLMDMATQYPTTIEELSKIQGVSLGKAQRYGKPFVDVIKKYVEDNDIERPMDFQVKSVANKSANKIYIIQNIDKKIPLDIVAKNKGMSFKQLIEEMETIVNSGTKLNITYYLNDLMDEDRQLDAMDYFREAENDSIENALVELGSDDYTEEELKLMRLKFVSDMGN